MPPKYNFPERAGDLVARMKSRGKGGLLLGVRPHEFIKAAKYAQKFLPGPLPILFSGHEIWDRKEARWFKIVYLCSHFFYRPHDLLLLFASPWVSVEFRSNGDGHSMLAYVKRVCSGFKGENEKVVLVHSRREA